MNLNIELANKVLEISKKRGSTHIGSCLSALPIIKEIYEEKKPEDVFVLSNGHAFLAWAVVLEHYSGQDAEQLAEKHGTHPTRSLEDGILVSTGSLGHGLGIALGMAIAGERVHCLISDGEASEGSIWEALRIKTELGIDNLIVHANLNGYTALGLSDRTVLTRRLKEFCPDIRIYLTENGPGFDGVQGHYKKI